MSLLICVSGNGPLESSLLPFEESFVAAFLKRRFPASTAAFFLNQRPFFQSLSRHLFPHSALLKPNVWPHPTRPVSLRIPLSYQTVRPLRRRIGSCTFL